MPKTKYKNKKSSKEDPRYANVTNKLIKLLETAQKPWEKPWHSTPYQNLISGHVYTGRNPLLIQIDVMLHEDWTSPYFVGFGQAKEQGWTIKKGSQATNILYGGTRKITTLDEDSGEDKESYVPFAKWNNVFSIHCIEDSGAKKKIVDFISEQTEKQNPDNLIERIEDFIAKQKANISYQGSVACYYPDQDLINMPRFEDFTSAYHFYVTKFHEFGHWTGHKSRLSRDMSGKFGTISYSFEELIAELTAAFIANFLGIDQDYSLEHHASYLQFWLTKLKEDNKFFFRALSSARKASDYMLLQAGLLTEEGMESPN